MSENLFWAELASGELWVAHNPAGLIAGFIPGYLDIDLSEREAARRAYAGNIARDVQRFIFSRAIAGGVIDVATVPDEVVDRLLGFGDLDDPAPWDIVVPLIVLGGSDDAWRPPPGNVVVVDARRDGSLILSLKALGEIESMGLLNGPALMLHPLGL